MDADRYVVRHPVQMEVSNPTAPVRSEIGGMMKLGDTLSWSNYGDEPVSKYRVLSAEIAAHPDKERAKTPWSLNNVEMSAQAKALNRDTDGRLTRIRWNKMGSPQDKPSAWDLNYAFDDGSVGRLTDVTYDEYLTSDRVGRVPLTRNGSATDTD